MRHLAIAGMLVLVTGLSVNATETVIQLGGHAWEDGGFPPSPAGDHLTAVGTINHIRAPLFWSPFSSEYTWCAEDLVSLGEAVFGTTVLCEYTGGSFRIHVDGLPASADYGVNPPNVTAPATFTDGYATYLEGFFTTCTLTYNVATASGGMVGEITFTGGNAFPQLQDDDGWAIGTHIGGVSPSGYDLQMNGSVYVSGPLDVNETSWSDIKTLYR